MYSKLVEIVQLPNLDKLTKTQLTFSLGEELINNNNNNNNNNKASFIK
jgi:hypothetical protein